ncbi:MAG: AAA family ATPase [Leptospiraceae bacterium]|nr:AAA family ATPase [Leptospiraceae bacterium]
MLSKIRIQNFKSIQSLTLNPKRVNLFIGKPSSGKSNILEALAFLSKTRFPYEQVLRMNS